MSYEKQTFVDNQTVLTARMMDHIEDGIVANETAITGASSSLASAFSTEAYYPSGSYVMKDGKLYVRTASGIGHGEWVAADWSETDIVTEMIARDDETMSRIYDIDEQTRKMIAPVYSTEEDYEIGDIVSYSDGKLYRCISPVSEEDWDATKWENVTVESLLNDGNKDNANMNKLTEIQSSDVVSSQRWVQGTFNDSGTAVASTTNLRMYSHTPSNLVVKVDVSGDYKYKIFRFNASDITLVDKTEWILPDDDPVFISVDKTQRANVVLSRLDETTIDISEASNVVVHLLYGNEYYSNVAETTGKNLIHYRMFSVTDGGATVSFNDETESVIVTAVGNTDYQCAQFYLNELQQICKVGHQYRLSYEAEVLSGTPYILMAVRGANGSPSSRVLSAGPGSAAPSGTYSFTFTMNEYMGRIMAQVSETANNPGASVRYYNISLREIMPDTAVDNVVREKVEETKGNEVALYPDMWFEFGGIDASNGRIYNGDATYMTMNRRTANYVKVDHDGYIYFKNPDASKFNLRIVQYNLDYTVREVQGLAYLESFCFMNSSDVMYKIQISAKGTTLVSEVPTLSDCHVGVYYPVQFISGIGSSEPKNTYCIMTHNIGQWTTGSGTRMTTNAFSWINLHDAIIERYSPDVLCLQEYLPYESITGNYYENSYAFNSPNNNVYSGKCILSNMPLENSTGNVYSNQASGNIACNWAKSYVWLGGHKVAIITTHLSTTLEKAQLQNAELKALADNEEYVIICGDFNVPCTATTDTNYINFFKPWVDAGYRMANGGQFGFMPTFYASSSVAKENGLCIDYIITSGNLDVSFACVDYQKYDAAIDTKIDHMPLVAYVSLSGAVRYDEEQTLTDTQKSTARGNISAASLIPTGTAFSQAVQGDTTYDVQDTAARAGVLAALDAQSAIDFGWVAGDQTVTGAGVTAVRNGNRITLNGTATSGLSSAQRFRMTGSLATTNGSPTAAQNVSGAVMTNGHRYMTVMRLVSGTAVYSGDGTGFLTLAPYKSGSTNVYFDAVTASDDYTYYIRSGYGDGSPLTLWVSFRSGWTFTNATYEVSLIDTTAADETQYPAALAIGASTTVGGDIPVEYYGVPGSITTSNKMGVSKQWGNRVTVNGVGNNSTYGMVTIHNGVRFLNNWNTNDNFVQIPLLEGHTYLLSARVISGTTVQVGNADSGIVYFTKVGTGAVVAPSFTLTMNADFANGIRVWTRRYTAAANTLIGFGFYFRQMTANNLVIEFNAKDITENTVTFTASTLTLAAIAGVRYICTATAVTQLTFTPCNSGICSVRFTAGSNMVLNLPQTVKMPDWWSGVEDGRTYEISIEDGVYGVVTSWA